MFCAITFQERRSETPARRGARFLAASPLSSGDASFPSPVRARRVTGPASALLRRGEAVLLPGRQARGRRRGLSRAHGRAKSRTSSRASLTETASSPLKTISLDSRLEATHHIPMQGSLAGHRFAKKLHARVHLTDYFHRRTTTGVVLQPGVTQKKRHRVTRTSGADEHVKLISAPACKRAATPSRQL